MNKKVKIIFIMLVVLNLMVLGVVSYLWTKSDLQVQANKKTGQNLKVITSVELAKYDGVDPKLPIYLAFDGFVYDITKGREFYQVGGPYHDLAGKESSKELHFAGGGIIKRKYPIVGIFEAGK